MRHAAWVIALLVLLAAGCARFSILPANPAEAGTALRPNIEASGTQDSSGMHIPRSPVMRQHVPW